ncbi:MAG: NAD regulator [Parvularculaceae bacterium]|nr:NAD regulator [Parvularculaceae bacterium]
MAKKPDHPAIAILLNAVLAVIDEREPKSLCVRRADGLGLPYGPFDPARHRTFELGLRSWVAEQTRVSLGYVEQLYTFGDKGREAPAAVLAGGDGDARVVSVGYLALAPEPAKVAVRDAQWRSWYEFFPWEDWRRGEPAILRDVIMPGLGAWTARAETEKRIGARQERVAVAFGLGESGWEEERALERYELMYEAGLVEEAWRDRAAAGLPESKTPRASASVTGLAMMSDHRRILATAIARLRGKLKYRPVIFEIMPQTFTLLTLQKTVEAIVGFEFHKQNFRRSVENGGLVVKTEAREQSQSGRPAALFRASPAVRSDRAAAGLAIPRLKSGPGAPR